ncbi:cyclohexanone 1,2-monooxygenase-like protein [Gymnopus androsaceus JB14]|uniref:Cyclohexanone 1,2-monooxygenase-like protein n=1 Tax=Gymnopus androsaceus JB14 TaxID=1447944 RepID=A0A6A4H354_9AGAR|nr:cyclohexanone 1,2-monooxygenase-like protein [Gymnopus androsaceus JB14]
MSETQEYDVIVVGGGFAGVHQLINLRKLGFTVKVLEAGGNLGGTWYWNRYPGARVDSELPIYQFSDRELWKDWTWSEKFPGWKELQAYFEYVDKKLDVKRDFLFNSRVASAVWDDSINRWIVTTEDRRVLRGQFLSLCTGIGSKYYVPEYKGRETFKGQVHHTSRWPEGCDLKGKRVGIIGTGATAVQIIQEIAPIVDHLTIFQRTPNFCLPMRQQKVNPEEDEKLKNSLYPVLFGRRNQTFSGFTYDLDRKPFQDITPEERTIFFEDKWEKGGFQFWLGTYGEIFTNQQFNDEAYAFWREKVRERIADPELQEKLAPMKAPHPFGVKRPSLEQRYFETYAQPNITLVDINKDKIEEITPNGLKTSDGTEHQFDVLIFATGFDMVTGGITSIDIRGQDGVPIKEKWGTDGVQSYLGLASATYPNMFWIYGPHSPSSYSNGPSSIELTSDWIIDCIRYMKDNQISSIVPTEEAQDAYSNMVNEFAAHGLWSGAKHSWYLGTNIPGKKVQMLQFPGGIPTYAKLCNEAAAKGYEGFHTKRLLLT